jgi:anti-sigma factor RsiW
VSGACRFRDDSGPWVLGALGEPDASAFSAHLAACDGCRREVAELQVVVDVLPMAAPQVVPSPELKTGTIGAVTSEAGLLPAAGDDTRTVPGFAPKGAAIALRMTDHHGELDLDGMPAPPAGRVYQVWLVTAKGRPRPTHALFTVAAGGRARVRIPESLKGADQVLVTAEPPGGSPQPTSPPIGGARLS